jgi:hypothetical protein
MGQQQFLLVVLGMILVGIAIAVAVTMFQAHAIDSSRNALINDLLFFATKARAYYWKPANLGGGNHDFSNLTMNNLSTFSENDNGRYYIESAATAEIVIVGVGRMVSGDDTVRVRMHINESTQLIEVLN